MPQSRANHAQNQRASFSQRLSASLEVAGIPPSATILQREYNRRSDQAPITTHAARKWLMGEAIPTQDRIKILADWLNVSPSWLRFGDDEIDGRRKSDDVTAQEWRLVKGFRLLTDKQRAAVLTMVLAIPAAGPKKSTRDP